MEPTTTAPEGWSAAANWFAALRLFVPAILFAVALAGVYFPPVLATPPPARAPTSISSPAAEPPVPVPVASAKALSYYRTGNGVWILLRVWSLLLPAVWLFTGASALLWKASLRLCRRTWPAIGLYAAAFIGLSTLATLPLSYAFGFVRPHAYGLSHQSLARWAGNLATTTAVAMAGGALLLWVPYWLLKRAPRRWWLYTWLCSLPLVLFILLLKPIWYDPLFHHFGPMRNKPLEAQILALADRSGIPAERVYEVNQSVDTTTVNAYVTGFLGSKRIVLWDTLLDLLEPDQVLFVMAHEIGHYVLGHVVRTILCLSLLNLAGLYVVHRAAGAILRRWGPRLGIRALSEPASLPLLLLLVQALALAATPPALAYSRAQEHEADRFALELTQLNHSGASGFARMIGTNLSNPWPGPLFTTWRATHPCLGQRVEFCNTYHPWREGRSSRYERLFRPAGARSNTAGAAHAY